MNDPTKSPCAGFEARIAELIGGAPSQAGFVDLCVHVRDCDACGELLEIHSRLQDLAAPVTNAPDEYPAEEDWSRVRQAVLSALESDPLQPTPLRDAERVGTTAPTRLEAAAAVGTPAVVTPPQFQRPLEWLAAAALAGILLGSGWWLGRATGDEVPTTEPQSMLARQSLPVNDDLDGYEIDNVRVRDVDGDQVSISFDLATHVETTRPRADPLVREAVVRSLHGGADLGGRIAAIEQAGELPLSDQVRDALVHAMLEDPDVAVRMSAQQRLATTELDDLVESALLQVLRLEQSVQMRLLAVDMLAERRVDPSELVRAVEAGQPEPGNALKLLAANYARRF